MDPIFKALTTPLDAQKNPETAKRFLRGGYKQDGFGIPDGAAVHGSFALDGSQGYYTEDPAAGRKSFLKTVDSMKEFFRRREKRLGKPIKLVIKPGIGGQHTPFQGIADGFQAYLGSEPKSPGGLTPKAGIIAGEYELGKNYEHEIGKLLKELHAGWDQVAVIPSSKSGSTDETMLIFVEIFTALLTKVADQYGIDGKQFSESVLNALHEVNFLNGSERPGGELFKMDAENSGTESLIELVTKRLATVAKDDCHRVFATVLGNMFFETVDRPSASRLSAFIRNSGLDKELGDDAPGFGAMFDNVGGRWTGDLHMMTFLAFYGLDAKKYWERRRDGIEAVRAGTHEANRFANRILKENIRDIALLIPEEAFWFGKSIEQNFNESIWQEGFATLVAVREKDWRAQKMHYANRKDALVINASSEKVDEKEFNVALLDEIDFKKTGSMQAVAEKFADLLTVFYGITTVVGNALIERALQKQGFQPEAVDLNRLDDLATRIVRENLYLLQPYVELGKGLLEKRLGELQAKERGAAGAIEAEFAAGRKCAQARKLETNIPELEAPGCLGPDPGSTSGPAPKNISTFVKEMKAFARKTGRKIVPFIYLEGEKFYSLRDRLIRLGVEWVMQGTGDQHISYQQVLAQPKKFLPFIISFVPEKPIAGRPAIGFAKGYLHNVSPHMVRDFFAEASYQALTVERGEAGGRGVFLRLVDSPGERELVLRAFN